MDLTMHHVGVTVSDLEPAIAFYRDTFNLGVHARFSVGGEAFARGADVPEASARFAHLGAGDARIELVEYEPVGTDRTTPTLDQPGATHLALETADIWAWYEQLRDSVETLSDPQTTESGATICFVRDPEENLIEVIER